MGSLRHTKSVSSFSSLPLEADAVHKSEATDSIHVIDCDFCSFSFETEHAVVPGVAHLRVRTYRTPAKWSLLRSGSAKLAMLLTQAFASEVAYIATFDFRDSNETVPQLVKVFCKVWSKLRRLCRPKSAALLIKGNIFSAISDEGPLLDFVTNFDVAVHPMVVCHCERVAEEFFKFLLDSESTSLSMASTSRSPFVALSGAHDVTDTKKESAIKTECQGSLQFAKQAEQMASVDGPTFHMLEDGSVRVVQVPPQDVMLQKVAGSGAKAECGGRAKIVALKFQCTARRLKRFKGTHFHLGELSVDAEVESLSRRTGRRMSHQDLDLTSLSQKPSDGSSLSLLCLAFWKNERNDNVDLAIIGCFKGIQILMKSLWSTCLC